MEQEKKHYTCSKKIPGFIKKCSLECLTAEKMKESGTIRALLAAFIFHSLMQDNVYSRNDRLQRAFLKRSNARERINCNTNMVSRRVKKKQCMDT